MSEEDIGRRARTLADGALHDSVTITALLETVDDGGHLHDGPPIEYLDADEQPHFYFDNTVKGISTGTRFLGKRPDPDAGTVILLTERRSLAVVGREAGDLTFSIPHDELEEAGYATTRRNGRLVLRAADTYHLWVRRSVAEETLADAAAFLAGGGDPD